MKNIIAILFLLPLVSRAQDSCQLKKETDPFTHVVKLTTGFLPFNSNGMQISISADATSTDIDFFIWIRNDPKCFDDQSTAQINYEGDRLKASFKNSGSMNCEGAFHFSFRNTPTTPGNLERLTVKKLSSIKLNGPNKTVTEIVFSEEQKQTFQRMAACVASQARTLIKP